MTISTEPIPLIQVQNILHKNFVNPTSVTNVPKINLFDTNSLTHYSLSPPHTKRSIKLLLSQINAFLSILEAGFIFPPSSLPAPKTPFFFKDGDLLKKHL